MPKGKRENFRVQLMLDRPQRKMLDRVVDVCNFAMHHAVSHALQRLETLKLVTPLQEFETIVRDFTKQNNPAFFDETKKEIAQHACELYTSVVAGAEYIRRRKHVLICVVPATEVIFSSSGRQVKVPYLGVVNYRRNIFAVSSGGGVFMPTPAHQMALGWVNNEASLVLMTKPPEKPKLQDTSQQKLVRLGPRGFTASGIARRKKAEETADPGDPE